MAAEPSLALPSLALAWTQAAPRPPRALVVADYAHWWRSLTHDPTDVARLATTLIVHYLCLITGEDATLPLDELLRRVESGDTNVLSPAVRSDGGESERRRALMTRLLCTLYYLTVFFRFDAHYSPLRVALVKWKAFGSTLPRGHSDDPTQGQLAVKIRTLLQHKMGAAFSEQDVRFLVFELTVELVNAPLLSTVVPPPAFSSASSAAAPAGPGGSGAYTTGPAVPSATDYVHPVPVVNSQAPLIEAACTSLLASFVSHNAATTLDERSTVLAALVSRLGSANVSGDGFVLLATLLRRQLLFSPFADPALVQDALGHVAPFCLLPQPLAGLARNLMSLLTMESRCPGATWRRNLERYFPMLAGAEPSGKELEAVLFAPPDSLIATALETFKTRALPERTVVIGTLLALFRACGFTDDAVPADASVKAGRFETHLAVLSLKKLRSLLRKTRLALEQTLQLTSAADAALYLAARMDHLKRAAEKHISRALQLQRRKASEAGTLAPEVPPLSIQDAVPLLCGLPWQYRVHRFTFDCILAGREAGGKLPRRNAQKPLRELVLEYAKLESASSAPQRLSVLVEGGDWEFHHVLSAYVSVALAADTAELLRTRVELAFFLLPTRRPSLLAGYLSAIDPWFAKTSAVNMRAATCLTPQEVVLQGEPQAEPLAADSYLMPPLLLQSLLCDYLTVATHRVNLLVWQCECWQKSVSSGGAETSKYVIPFVLSAKLGIGAQALLFQMLNDVPPGSASLVGSKVFRFKPPVFSMKIVSSSLRGVPRQESDVEARPWHEVFLGAVPTPGRLCDLPTAESPWLEMYAAPSGDVVDGAKASKRKKPLLRGGTHHVRSVEIEGHAKSTFEIALDGVPYGPFCKVVISPCAYGDAQAVNPVFVSVPLALYAETKPF